MNRKNYKNIHNKKHKSLWKLSLSKINNKSKRLSMCNKKIITTKTPEKLKLSNKKIIHKRKHNKTRKRLNKLNNN
jgi:hypothetical protein